MRYEGDNTIYAQQVCLNGHQISIFAESNQDPNPPIHCEKCGEKAIQTCQNCKRIIDGRIQMPNVLNLSKVKVPAFCKHCGKPYPWTVSTLENAIEMIALDAELSKEDKELIKSALPDLLVDTPKTQLAATKYQIVISKATKVVKDSLYNFLIDFASETAKKILFP